MQSLPMPRFLGALLIAVSLFLVPACKGKNRDAEIQTAFNSKTRSDPNLAGVSATAAPARLLFCCLGSARGNMNYKDNIRKQ